MKNTLVLFIEAIRRDRLAATAGARLQIAAELVERTARNTAIVALGETEIISAFAIRHAIILLRVDHELSGLNAWLILGVPSGLLRIPRHKI